MISVGCHHTAHRAVRQRLPQGRIDELRRAREATVAQAHVALPHAPCRELDLRSVVAPVRLSAQHGSRCVAVQPVQQTVRHIGIFTDRVSLPESFTDPILQRPTMCRGHQALLLVGGALRFLHGLLCLVDRHRPPRRLPQHQHITLFAQHMRLLFSIISGTSCSHMMLVHATPLFVHAIGDGMQDVSARFHQAGVQTISHGKSIKKAQHTTT
mmetsp:Transcript_100122/g.283572  ORF Transcript_100122/g.283572 Transcript_100122/m.283572 type:complete len:212 (+) Transcript_100122:343-978(+)